MIREDAFHVLGIEPTGDKKKIKKAYAGLVKIYHPEEYPERWKSIHEAYENALKQADRIAENGAEGNVITLEKIELAMATRAAAEEASRKQKEKGQRQEEEERKRREEGRKQKHLEEETRRQKEEERKRREEGRKQKHLEEETRRQKEEERKRREEGRKQKHLEEEARRQKEEERERREEEKRTERVFRQQEENWQERQQEYLEAERQRQREEENIFENIDELIEEERKKQYEDNCRRLERAIDEMEGLGTDYEGWRSLFDNEVYADILVCQKFIVRWGEVVQGKLFNEKLYNLMKDELQLIRQYLPLAHNSWTQIATEKVMAQTEKEVYLAYKRYQEKKPSGGMIFLAILLLSIFVAVFMFDGRTSNRSKIRGEAKERISSEQIPVPVNEQDTPGTEQSIQESGENVIAQLEETHESGEDIIGQLKETSDPVEESRKNGLRMLEMVLADNQRNQAKIDRTDMLTLWEGLYLKNIYGDEAGYISVKEIEIPEQAEEILGKELTAEDGCAFTFELKEAAAMPRCLYCDFGILGLTDESRVFYYDGTQYVEILSIEEGASEWFKDDGKRYKYRMDGLWAFVFGGYEKGEYPLVFVR